MMIVEGITKYFSSRKALDNVSFEVKDSEIAGFVGLNGAGETTTIRTIVGVLKPNSSDALIDGKSIVKEKKEVSKNVGWVPELPICKILKVMSINEIRNLIKSNDVKVVLNQVNENVVQIAQAFGKPELSGNTLLIHDFNNDVSVLVFKLTPYGVLEISKLGGNLEEVFFKVVRGEV